jgi:hypothetical protein
MDKDLEALKRAVDKLGYSLWEATVNAFLAEAELIKEDSMVHCPVAPDGGTLRGSHEVVGPVKEGNDFLIWVQVGGPSDAYAQAVHEHLSEYSPPSWVAAEESGRGIHWNAEGTGPKFLENAARAAMPGMAERVAARARRNM